MVTTTLIGGYGNQLFQIAAAIGYARLHGMEYRIPMKAQHPWPTYHVPGVAYSMEPLYTKSRYREPALNYENRPYNITHQVIPYEPRILIEGHFQSEKYFKHCQEEVRNLFDLGWTSESGWVSIHIRRGDYLKMSGHLPPITDEYLQRAIGYMESQGYTKFVVFGDDPKWNREYVNDHRYPGLTIEHFKGVSPQEDMRRASCCEHNIGSNSSYSWWIHWLNRNNKKIGIFPETWFGPAYGTVDMTDLYPSGEISIGDKMIIIKKV